MLCPRSITFMIPGLVGLQVKAVEDGGSLLLTVDVLDTARMTGDLRGLFFHFDEALLAGLSIACLASAPMGQMRGVEERRISGSS